MGEGRYNRFGGIKLNNFMANSERREMATDIELAMGLIQHIEEPCRAPTGDNIREFYLKEARRVLETMKNSDAKALLQEAVERYIKK